MSGFTDILIIGGPEIAFTNSDAKVRQVPFTFAGLAEAYRVLSEAVSVILEPNIGIYAETPTFRDIACFGAVDDEDSLFDRLGTPYPLQTGRRADDLAPAYTSFSHLRQIAAAFIERVLDRMFKVARSGGKAYLLVPEDTDKPSGLRHGEDKMKIIREIIPGLSIDRDETWTMRADGDYAWLLEGTASRLWFGLTEKCVRGLGTAGAGGIPDPLPASFMFSPLLTFKDVVSAKAGAVDPAGRWRIAVLRWGKGEFVVAPASCRQNLLARLCETPARQKDAAPVACDVSTPDQMTAAATRGPLESMLPSDPRELMEWDRQLKWRQGSIRSVASLALTIDALQDGPRLNPRDVRIRVFMGEGRPSGQDIAANTLRKLLERKIDKKKIQLSEGLRSLLEEALLKFDRHFLHTS